MMNIRKICIITVLLMLFLCGCQNNKSGEPLDITLETNADKEDKSTWWYEYHISNEDTDDIERYFIENTEKKDKYVASLDFDSDDAYRLEKIAVAEADGMGTECIAAVMMVVLNRTWSSDFPMSIENVIMQYHQFTPVLDGRYDEIEPNDDSREALNMVLHGWDEVNGALYFESCEGESWYSRNLELTAKYGNMRFYR